jgi:hypothetical protein
MARKLDHCPHCGCDLSDDSKLPRSPKQNRAFHHMIGMALDSWPEAAEFQPEGRTKTARFEHIKAYLLCKARHRDILGDRLKAGVLHTEAEMVKFAQALIRESRERPCFVTEHMGMVVIVAPKATADTSHEDFQPVFDEVMAQIEELTGIKVEFIKRELRKFR